MSDIFITRSEDSLAHYGVLGMKWGVRRYQNADGSLTDKGKKRYGYDEKSGQYIKKSANTRSFERLAASGQRHAKKQDALYKSTKHPYHKKSAEQWRKESSENAENAKKSFENDVRKKTMSKAERYKASRLDAYEKAYADNKKLEKTYTDQINKIKKGKDEAIKELRNQGYSKETSEKAYNYYLGRQQRYLDMGRDVMAKEEATKKKISSIDTSSQSYRQAKKQIKAIEKESADYRNKRYYEYQIDEQSEYRKVSRK